MTKVWVCVTHYGSQIERVDGVVVDKQAAWKWLEGRGEGEAISDHGNKDGKGTLSVTTKKWGLTYTAVERTVRDSLP